MKSVLSVFLFVFVAIGTTLGCDPGWYKISDGCFWLDWQKMPYQEARNYCNSLKKDADLAILQDSDTHRIIYDYIMHFDLAGTFWLGGTDAEFEGDWKWVDGSRITQGTPFWAVKNGAFGFKQEPLGEEDQNCAVLDEDRLYYMDDRSCFDSNIPICMYKP